MNPISNDNLPKSMRYGLMSSNAVQAEATLARYSSVNGTSYSPTGSSEIRIKVKANGFLETSKHYLSFTVTTATANGSVDTSAQSFFDRVEISANGNVVENIQSYGLYASIRHTYNSPLDKIFKHAAEAGAAQLEFKNEAADAGADDGKIIKVRPGSLGEKIVATNSKVFCIQLESGLLLNHHAKALPDGLVELDIVLRLAGNNQALIAATGQAPTYTISDPALYCPVFQILNGDVMASYRSVVAAEGIMWSGDSVKTYINSMTNGAGTKNLQINDRSLSCKALVTAFRDEGVDSVIDKYANGAYGFQDGTGSLTSFRYVIGSKNFPASDININTATDGLNVGRASEETLKALAKHGEKYCQGTVDRTALVGNILDVYASDTDAASTEVPKGLVSVDLKKFSDDGLRMVGLNTAANSSPNTLEVTHTAMAGALSATTFAIVEAFFQMSPTGSLTSAM